MRSWLVVLLLTGLSLEAQTTVLPDRKALFEQIVQHLDQAENIKVIATFPDSFRTQISYSMDNDKINVQLDFNTVLPPSWLDRQKWYQVDVPFVGRQPNLAQLRFKDRKQSIDCYQAIRQMAASFGSTDANKPGPPIDHD